jgi:hypothetical protein
LEKRTERKTTWPVEGVVKVLSTRRKKYVQVVALEKVQNLEFMLGKRSKFK